MQELAEAPATRVRARTAGQTSLNLVTSQLRVPVQNSGLGRNLRLTLLNDDTAADHPGDISVGKGVHSNTHG